VSLIHIQSYTDYMLLAQDTVWHFWLAVPLAALAILAVVMIVGLYFFKITRARYPREQG
jgi:hypothetical protein